jgi:hypothetical protein
VRSTLVVVVHHGEKRVGEGRIYLRVIFKPLSERLL